MTDKVQKIRKEVERRRALNFKRKQGSRSLEDNDILSFIDSLQEEPAPKIFEDMLNAKTPAESLGISQEEHDRIVDELIYGKEPELVDVDDLPNKEEEPVSEAQVKESAEVQHVNETCKENDNSLTQEPVSNVWHDMSEEAENGRNIIIIDPKDFYGAVLRKGGSQLRNHNKERYVKWAYIDDLFNL